MKPGETVRFVCRGCHAVFDLCLAPYWEWTEHTDDADFFDALDLDPRNCPFCDCRELKPLQDRPVLG